MSQAVAQRVEGSSRILHEMGTVVLCPPRSEFCRQGDAPGQVFLVHAGLVTASIINDEGREYCLCYRSAGWIFGTASAISETPHSVTLRAQTSAKIRVIDSASFTDALHRSSELSAYVHCLHSREIREQGAKLSGLALYSTRQRLEEFLWQMVPTLTAMNGKLQLPFSDADITKFISTTPQYLSAILKQLQNEGVIKRANGWLVVHDRSQLWHRELSTEID